MRTLRWVGSVVIFVLTSCASPRPAAGPAPAAVGSGPAGDSSKVLASAAAAGEPRGALFYSDLGPNVIDVSDYPERQRHNYAVYARVCSRCHLLARSINAPIAGRGWWEFYLMGMRARSRWDGRPMSKQETAAILDFLDYDSRRRKIERARDFERQTEELKRRFDAALAARVRELLQANPRALEPPSPNVFGP